MASLLRHDASPPPLTWRARASILLLVPNVVGWIRLLIVLPAFYLLTEGRCVLFLTAYLLFFLLDGVDGAAARRLAQVSAFGALLDVALDCFARTAAWSVAVPGPVGVLVPCLEWLVFVATHKQGGAAWKTGCFAGAPAWVKAAISNGFKSPGGVLVIAGLHFFPLWLWARTKPGLHNWFIVSPWIGAVLATGRVYCLAIELWTLGRYLDSVLADDVLARTRKSK